MKRILFLVLVACLACRFSVAEPVSTAIPAPLPPIATIQAKKPVVALAFAKDAVAIGLTGGCVKLYDTGRGKVAHEWMAQGSEIRDLCFAPGFSNRLAALSVGKLRVGMNPAAATIIRRHRAALNRWDTQRENGRGSPVRYFLDPPSSLSFLEKDQLVLGLSRDVGTIGWTEKTVNLRTQTYSETCSVGSAFGKVWVAGRRTGQQPGRLIGGLAVGMPLSWTVDEWQGWKPANRICHIELTAQPEQVVFATEVGAIAVLSGSSARLYLLDGDQRTTRLYPASVRRLALSATGEYLALALSDQTQVWDIGGNQVAGTIPTSGSALAFSPDGRRLAVGDDKGAVRIFEVAND